MSELHPSSSPPSGQAVACFSPIGSLAVTRCSPSSPLVQPRSYLVQLVPIFQTNSSCVAYSLP
jgi:hypothetical protein